MVGVNLPSAVELKFFFLFFMRQPCWECARVVNCLCWGWSLLTGSSGWATLNYGYMNGISFQPPETLVITSDLEGAQQTQMHCCAPEHSNLNNMCSLKIQFILL